MAKSEVVDASAGLPEKEKEGRRRKRKKTFKKRGEKRVVHHGPGAHPRLVQQHDR
jgi:hypothetical protein